MAAWVEPWTFPRKGNCISLDEGRRRNIMKDLREMYKELYAEINAMPLPTSPDDPEPAEPEEYVEPAWYATFGTTAEDDLWEF